VPTQQDAPYDPADAQFPLRTHLGMEIGIPEAGHGAASLVVGPEHLNPNGVVHGAVLFALIDTAMGAATMSILDEGRFCASVDVHMRFIRPLSEGSLEIAAEVLNAGRRMVQLSATAHDGNGRLIATATGAFMVMTREP
jgi:acyl-CoA thioesterase